MKFPDEGDWLLSILVTLCCGALFFLGWLFWFLPMGIKFVVISVAFVLTAGSFLSANILGD